MFDKIKFEALRAACEARGISIQGHPVPIEDMSWSQLHTARSEVRRAAVAMLAHIKAATNDAESEARAALHDTAMAVFDLVSSEFDARQAADTREPLDRRSRRPGALDGEARSLDDDDDVNGFDGGWVGTRPAARGERWLDTNGKEVRVLSQGQPFAKSEQRAKGPGIGDAMRALVMGPRDATERRALAEGVDASGGYTVPEILSGAWIDRLRAEATVFRAGARTVDMTSEKLAIAKIVSDPVATWKLENATVGDGDMNFGKVQFQARTLIALVKTSRELLEDSINVSAMLEHSLTQAFALELDRVALFGSGTDPEPLGVINTSGINIITMATNGATPTSYDKLLDALYEIESRNGGKPSAMIWNPRTGLTLAKLKDTTGQPLTAPEAVAKIPKLATTSVPIDETEGTATTCSSVLTGDFTRLLVGMRNNLRIEMLRERYADAYQVGFVAALRADVTVEQAVAFTRLKGIKP